MCWGKLQRKCSGWIKSNWIQIGTQKIQRLCQQRALLLLVVIDDWGEAGQSLTEVIQEISIHCSASSWSQDDLSSIQWSSLWSPDNDGRHRTHIWWCSHSGKRFSPVVYIQISHLYLGDVIFRELIEFLVTLDVPELVPNVATLPPFWHFSSLLHTSNSTIELGPFLGRITPTK